MIFLSRAKITRKDDDSNPAWRGIVRPHLPFHSKETYMKKTILTFGLISGAISSVMMIATVPFANHGSGSLVLGYTTIVLSFLLVFFGIRSYRDNQGNG